MLAVVSSRHAGQCERNKVSSPKICGDIKCLEAEFVFDSDTKISVNESKPLGCWVSVGQPQVDQYVGESFWQRLI